MERREVIPTLSSSPKRYRGTKTNFSSLGDLSLPPNEGKGHHGYRERSVDVERANGDWPMVRERSIDSALSDERRTQQYKEKSLVKSLDDLRTKDDNFVRESQNALRRSTRRSRKREKKPRGTSTSPKRTNLREKSPQMSYHANNRDRQPQSRSRSRTRDFDSSTSSDNVISSHGSYSKLKGRPVHVNSIRTRDVSTERSPFSSSDEIQRPKENRSITSWRQECAKSEPLEANQDRGKGREIELTMPGRRISLEKALYEGLGDHSGDSIPLRKRPEEIHAFPSRERYRMEGPNRVNINVLPPHTHWKSCDDIVDSRMPVRQNQTTKRPPVPLPRTGSNPPYLGHLANTPHPSNGSTPPPSSHNCNYMNRNSNNQTRNISPPSNLDCNQDKHHIEWDDPEEERRKLNAGRYEGISAICHFISIALCLMVTVPMAGVAAAWENKRRRCPLFVQSTPQDNVQWGNESMAPCNYVAFMPLLVMVFSLALLITHSSLLYQWHNDGKFPELLVTRKYALSLLAFNFLEFIFMFSIACTLTDGFRQTCLSFELSPYPEVRPANCKRGFFERDEAYSLEDLHTFARTIAGIVGSWLCSALLFFVTLLTAVRGKLCSCNIK